MALSPDGSVLYLAGTFTSIAATPRTGFAAFTTADLHLTSWAPGDVSAGSVAALAVDPAGTVYVGGSFTGIAGNGRNRLAAISPAGSVTSWNPGANDAVFALAATASTLYVGGSFTTLGHDPRAGSGRWTLAPATGSAGPGAAPTRRSGRSRSPAPRSTRVATSAVSTGSRARLLGAVNTADGVATASPPAPTAP